MSRPIKNRMIYSSDQASFRAFEDDGKRYLEGYAAVFNQRSKLLYENGKFFYEIIAPGAFDEVLRNSELDVYLTFNHERGRVMARTVSETLKLSVDDKGLLFRAELPNVSYAHDVWELVSRGDLFENSFAFVVPSNGDEWTHDKEGNNIRLVKRISKLIDVSVVTAGAYADTTVSAREAAIKVERGKVITITISDDEVVDEEVPEVEEPIEDVVVDPSTNEPVEESECGKIAEEEEEEDEEEKAKRNKQELEKYRMRIETLKLKYR